MTGARSGTRIPLPVLACLAAFALPTATAVAAEPPWQTAAEIDAAALVATALERNPTLASMTASAAAAAERVPQVSALDDPDLSYALAPRTIGSDDFDLGYKIELSQALPWPGTLATRGDVARRETEAAEADLEAARLRLIAAVRERFFDWWYAHRALALTGEETELLAELREIAEIRYASGLASKQDALQAELEYQRLLHRAVVFERSREVTLVRLNALLARPAKSPIPRPPAAIAPPHPVAPIERLEELALERRTELVAQRRRVEGGAAAVRLAELEFLPDFRVFGSYDTLWDADELRPMVGVALNLPIQIASRRAALAEARARLRRERAMLAEVEAELRAEVGRAAEELREQAHVVELYDRSILPAAEANLEAARSGYEAATSDFSALVTAAKDLIATRLTRARGLAESRKALARLERATGGPLPPSEDHP